MKITTSYQLTQNSYLYKSNRTTSLNTNYHNYKQNTGGDKIYFSGRRQERTPIDVLAEMVNSGVNAIYVREFIKAAQNHTSAVKGLSNLQINGIPIWNGVDILELIDVYEKHRKEVIELSKLKNKDNTYALDAAQVKLLAPIYKKNKKETLELLELIKTRPDMNYYFVKNTAPIYKKYKNEITEMFNYKDTNGEYLFSGIGFAVDLAPLFKHYRDVILLFATMKDKKGTPRFNSKDIADIIKEWDTHSKEIIELSERKYDNGEYVFKHNQISRLAPLYKENSNDINTLINMKNPKGRPLFDGHNICEILCESFKTPEVFDIAQKLTTIYCGEDIAKIITTNKNKKEILELAGLQKEGEETPLIPGHAFNMVMPLYENFKELFLELINTKDSTGQYVYNYSPYWYEDGWYLTDFIEHTEEFRSLLAEGRDFYDIYNTIHYKSR